MAKIYSKKTVEAPQHLPKKETISFLLNYSKALKIGFTEVITKVFLFYLHERVWMHYTRKKEAKNDTF